MSHDLPYYLSRFSKLRRNHHATFGNAPHKPILLLSLLRAIDLGVIKENFVSITPELAAIFSATWENLVPGNTWQEQMAYPFRYLVTEGFWELIKDGRVVAVQEVGVPSNLFQLVTRIDGGQFAPDLWALLQDPTARAALQQQLLSTYFSDHNEAQISTASVLSAQVDRLRTQATAKFRLRPAITDDAGMFVRHSLFPTVIRGLYGNACAVCRRDDRIANQSIVDAAHVMPFGEFHNDDPRNGIALCKNHHWAFDAGAIGFSENYEVVLSKKVVTTVLTADHGSRLILPSDPTFAVAQEALAWHRERWALG